MNNKKHMEDILHYFEKYHYENMILDDNEAKFIHDYIINLQSKIDKVNNYIDSERKKIQQHQYSTGIRRLNKIQDIIKEVSK